MGAILDFPQEKDGISICQNIRLKLLMCVLSVTKALNGNTLLLPIWLFIQWKRSTYAKNVDFLPPMLQHSSFTKESLFLQFLAIFLLLLLLFVFFPALFDTLLKQ